MEHEDRPIERDAVEVLAGESGLGPEVDRVESTDDDRLVRSGSRCVEFTQPVEQTVVGADTRCDPAVDPVPIEPSDVRQKRERTLQRVGVRLDHPGHDDVLGESAVDGVGSPAGALVERPGSEDAPLTHGDRLDGRLGRIHRDDRACGEDRDLAHPAQRSR